MKKFLMFFLLIFICGCSHESGNDNSYQSIMQKEDYIIVDVRSKEEYEELHVKGAVNIPYDEINEDIDIPKDKVIFVYCRSGARSSVAYSILKSLNYKVYDLGAIDSIDLAKE